MWVARMDDPGVDGGVEDDFGVVDDIGVERIVTSDEHGHPPLSGPAGTTGLLPQGGQSAGPAGDDDEVEPGDVDAELQGIRQRRCQQLPRTQSGLEHPPFLSQIPSAVGGDLSGQRLIDLTDLIAHGLGECLGAAAGGDEGE